MTPVVMNIDGTCTELIPVNGTDFSLSELYEALDCKCIEILYMSDGTLLVFDEEGRLVQKPVNNQATSLITDDLTKAGRILQGGTLLGLVLHCDGDHVR